VHDLHVHSVSASDLKLTLCEPVCLSACTHDAVCLRSADVRDGAETVNKHSTHTPAIAKANTSVVAMRLQAH